MKAKIIFLILFLLMLNNTVSLQNNDIDSQVETFLESHKNKWRDWNITSTDGKVLYDLIIENNYKNALEIGTSTGHSAIWIAWALSKTGGRLITIEINESRYNKALINFKKAGVSDYIEVRLGDAHDIVKELKEPFDFIFCDADKKWYINYFKLLSPKLVVGGCFCAHNVLNDWMDGIQEFLNYIQNFKNYKTEIVKSSSSGISISYKRK